MSGIAFAAFLFCAAMVALNTALYVSEGNPLSLAAAIFCGACGVANLAMGRRS